MKRNITLALFAALFFNLQYLSAQVPNGGFENWTAGNPDLWTTDNIIGLGMPVTQATPGNSGLYAVKGEVVNTLGGPITPLVTSQDSAGYGFAISQSYATLGFYYKTNFSASAILNVGITINDLFSNPVGYGAQAFAGNVGTFTLANVPITYFASGAAECIIYFSIADTVLASPPVGEYFIIDDVTLSGTASVQDLMPGISSAMVKPNPSNSQAVITLDNAMNGNAVLFLFDNNGRLVKKDSRKLVQGKTFDWEFSVADLPAGIYTAHIVCGRNQWKSTLVKE